MTDQRLRELERRFKETQDPAAWGAWLRARVRQGELDAAAGPLIERIEVGTLTRERVQLAGYLGDPLALALDENDTIALATYLADAPAVRVALGSFDAADVHGWLVGLAHWGAEPLVRACVACSIAAREALRAEAPDDDPYAYDNNDYYLEMTDRILEGPLRWLGCPCEAHALEGMETASGLEYLPRPSIQFAYLACEVARDFATQASWPERYALELTERSDGLELVEMVRAALIPWALGGT